MIHNHKAERRLEIIETSRPTPSDTSLPTRRCLIVPKSSTNWEPNIQIYDEPMGTIPIQITTQSSPSTQEMETGGSGV